MRIFHELVTDDYVTGTATRITPSHWSAVMGNIDVWRFMIVVDRVSGGSPTLSVAAVEMPKMFLGDLLSLTGGPLVAGQTNTFTASFAPNDVIVPSSYSVQFIYSLGGTSPAAHVRIWATGRGRA